MTIKLIYTDGDSASHIFVYYMMERFKRYHSPVYHQLMIELPMNVKKIEFIHSNGFVSSAECLGEIEQKLSSEDSSTRSMRRAFGFMDVLNKDFIPILLWSKEKPAIFRAVVK